MSQTPNVYGADGGELFDLGQGKLWLGFVLRSVRRHLLPFFLTTALIGGLGILLSLSGAKQYLTGSTILARNDSSLLNATNPGAGGSPTDESPAELAPSIIKSQKFLGEVVDELQLVQRRNVGETSLGKLKRTFFESIFSKPTEADARRDVIDKLRAALTIDLDQSERNKQSVNLGIIWNDPDIAKAIIDAVGTKFMTTSRNSEIETMKQARDINSDQLKKQNDKVAKMRDDLGFPESADVGLPDSLKAEVDLQTGLKQKVLDTERALKSVEAQLAFNYRTVIPAERPLAPLSGGLTSLLASVFAGAIVGAFVTTLLDLLRGRVVEAWQVTRRLNLPLLADLKN